MASSGEEGVGAGAELTPNQVCSKSPDFKTNSGVF